MFVDNVELMRKKGREVGEKILAQIIQDNHLDDMEGDMPDIFGKNQWIDKKKRFVKCVEDLFVQDAYKNF